MSETFTVVIKRNKVWTRKKTANFCTSETPTDKVQQRSYGSGDEVVMAKTFEPREVDETVSSESEVYQQTVEMLDLAAVIRAVNGMDSK